jgi:hypothetical protein
MMMITSEINHFTIFIVLKFVIDGISFDDGLTQSTTLLYVYGLTPSIDCIKARISDNPAFLAPNSKGIFVDKLKL